MGKYDKFSRPVQVRERPWEVHPVWRGIGCLLMIIIPFMAYAGADLLVKANLENGWIAVPFELATTVTIPLINLSVPNLYAILLVAVLLAIIGFGVLTIFNALIYRVAHPSQLDMFNAPPERRKPRRKK
jgi:hypothetical protein